MSSLLHNVDVPTKKATFAMGCFWGPDSLYGAIKGVIRTRVGYAGGTKVNPTYRSLGDHTESIDIDFDPNQVSYDKLLDAFWDNHDPTAKTSVQYTSLVFYHDDEQKELAERTLKEREVKKKSYFVTKVIPFKEFWNAEDFPSQVACPRHCSVSCWREGVPGPYSSEQSPSSNELVDWISYHQKYRLQQHTDIVEAIGLKSGPMLLTSHLAARLNGYVVGFGGVKQFDEEVEKLGLDEKTAEKVRKLVVRYEGHGMTC